MGDVLIGLKEAFLKDENKMELETDNLEALKEWEDWKSFLDPNHTKVIEQLEQRKGDRNLKQLVRPIGESKNAVTRCLAQIEAMQRV